MSLKSFIIEKENIKERTDKIDLRKKLVDFFSTNKKPKDTKIHNLAEKLDMDPDDLETAIYSILSDFFAAGKYYSAKKKPNINEDELKAGIKVEMEHTNCPLIAEKIAKDHLIESFPLKYYTDFLNPMEKQMEENKSKG
jgi:hypothetical protein